MTKVPRRELVMALVLAAAFTSAGRHARAGTGVPDEAGQGRAARLYQQLGSVGLDPARVYRVRDASLERPGVHITLEDGMIAFTQDVQGHVTGAFFEGEGEILVAPPNETERHSMSLFTGMAILEEHFATAYLRFNDETAAELGPGLRAAEDSVEFYEKWKTAAAGLAETDALRLLLTFSRALPVSDSGIQAVNVTDPGDRMLHARLQGTKLGAFDVYYDAAAAEGVEIGQARQANDGRVFYDVWTSFYPVAPGRNAGTAPDKNGADAVRVNRFVIHAQVKPPTRIEAEAVLELETRRPGERTLMFELSRFIRVQAVELNGHPVEFIHNPAMEGTQLARRGNDAVAVILDKPSEAGQRLSLKFVYGGEVLAEAGPGLVYVGARGNWYPNRGMAMADYDLEFRYPPGWTLVATGKPVEPEGTAPGAQAAELISRWISERPIPVAGFNLGKYKRATTQAGSVTVESYGSAGVERDFPSPTAVMVDPFAVAPGIVQAPSELVMTHTISPAQNAQPVANAAAAAIRYYAERFGPFPYSRLALTQLPGEESQGWPGLIFLSSFAFLTDAEREALHKSTVSKILEQQIPAHETAHQWWGDLITWRSYRDQWISEALANYCSLMELEGRNPSAFRQVLDDYRQKLLKNPGDGKENSTAGPVTLGIRLGSSQSTEAYEPIVYGRGAWLIHMLRMMLRDASRKEGMKDSHNDALFLRSLRTFRERYEGGAASTRDLLASFEENLPPTLRFEGKQSLDWFMSGWVEGTAIPRLSLHGVKLAPSGHAMEVSGTIEQKRAPVNLVTAVPIYAVVAGDGTLFIGQVFADGAETQFRLVAPAGTRRILLDPKHTILSDVR